MKDSYRHGPMRGSLLAIGLACLAAGAVVLGADIRDARAQDTAGLLGGPVARQAGEGPQTQRLVFAQYYYWFQGDTRKPVPSRNIRNKEGLTVLTNHPWESVGPWMSFDRSQWHKNQFQMMAAGGIDVALAVYRGDLANRRA